MTALVETALGTVRAPAEIRRARVLSVVYMLMAIATIWFFARGTEGDAIFRIGAQPGDLDLTVPASGFGYFAAAVFGFLAGMQLIKGLGKWTNVVLAIALFLFVIAFLAWAAAGKSFSLSGMMRTALLNGTPIAFGALSGVMCERVAVINIGIEGMLLAGAFAGALVGSVVNQWMGIVAAALAGGLLAAGLAVLAIRYRVDQIIAGVVINIFALGMTSFLGAQILAEDSGRFNSPGVMRPIKLPLLGDIPILGQLLFNHNIFVYILYAITAAMTYGLFKTRWGLRSRAVGEHPKAADTLGVHVYRLRYLNVILGGMIAGIGGAFFTLGSVGAFNENMTGGRGFIGLAAMIFGRWHPVGALGAALVFGFADSLQVKLAILDTGIPSDFLLMAPYITTLIVVAGVVGKSRPPAADGQPYIKE
jgi:ABC-type uncharacterized transport system permease subunit